MYQYACEYKTTHTATLASIIVILVSIRVIKHIHICEVLFLNKTNIYNNNMHKQACVYVYHKLNHVLYDMICMPKYELR